MIPWFAAAFLVVGFMGLMKAFGLVERTAETAKISRDSLRIVADPGLDDEQKEVALQANAIRLMKLAVILAAGLVAAASLPLGLLWLCDRCGILSLEAVLRIVVTPAFLVASIVLALVLLPVLRRAAKSEYSLAERFLCRVAFNTVPAQLGVADAENRIYAKSLKPYSASRPVFITSLPRAGTTMLLELCARLPDFASHCYRDMPFVLTPCIWQQYSSAFSRSGTRRERSHGDGMLVSPDSHEALEEVLWMAFWRRQYRKDHIAVWETGPHPEFKEFFQDHMRKIVSLRREGEHQARYLSKNNLNIARIAWLRHFFPDSVIVVPFRHPLQHAASLLEQHANFLGIHARDPFARRYMRAIGHFDFGENLRPVDFDGWLANSSSTPDQLQFWLEYWIAAFKHILAEDTSSVHFVHYEHLCEEPGVALAELGDIIATSSKEELGRAASTLRPVRLREVDETELPSAILAEVLDLYETLKSRSGSA